MKDPKIVKKGKFVVVGLMYRGKNENQEIAGLWPQLMARFGELKNEIISHESYGVMGNMDDETGEFDYLAGFPVAGEFDAPDGMKTWDVPEQKYAVFPTTLPDLMDTFTKIYLLFNK